MTIDGRRLGPDEGCLVIGEVAQGHDGSLGIALSFIDAIADAGADAVKFQTHIAEAESTPGEPWRVQFSLQDESRYDYWVRTSFDERGWQILAERAADRGLLFLSSPFSADAVDLLCRVGVSAWKIASGQLLDLPMLERIAATGLPAIASTGLSDLEEIDRATTLYSELGIPFALLQCTSMYPTPPELVGLNVMRQLADRYGCPVGLSDHTGIPATSLAAVAQGASVLEVHVTFSRKMFGPDTSSSLTVDAFEDLVASVRHIERIRRNPVDKDRVAGDLEEMHRLFTKSVVAARDLPQGAALTRDDVTTKKPGTGIPAWRLPEIVGRTLRRAVSRDDMITEADLEPMEAR